MRVIDTDGERAEDVFVELAGHVPPDVVIGMPRIVTGRSTGCMMTREPMLVGACEMVLTDDGGAGCVWFLEDGAAARLTVVADGRRELTRWSRGVEVSRQLTAL